jgi:Zn-dependent protease
MNIDFIFSIIILILSVVMHEVSHGYAAYMQGDKTAEYEGRLTMNPLKHLDFVGSFLVPILSYSAGGFILGWAKPVPYNPYNLRNQKWGEALVAAAGPASNLLIATIFGLFIRFVSVGTVPMSFISIAMVVTYINILLAIFNLIPVPPLDGSKILFAFLPVYSGARAFLERNGLIITLFIVFFLWRFIQPLVRIVFTLITGHVA